MISDKVKFSFSILKELLVTDTSYPRLWNFLVKKERRLRPFAGLEPVGNEVQNEVLCNQTVHS
jgi:hypothetical protein